MQLRIAPTRQISEVQVEFNSVFPFLKLEFYQNKAQKLNSLQPGIRVPHNKRVGDCQAAIIDGEVEVTKEMKVKDLEQRLKDQFGLNVQVFRRSGNLWLQTTMTDSWTLEKQNEHGMELSKAPEKPAIASDEDQAD